MRHLASLVVATSCAAFVSCAAGHITGSFGQTEGGVTGSTTGSGGASAPQAITQNETVSGTVSAAVINSGAGTQQQQIARLSSNSCAGATYQVYEVGGNGNSIASGSTDSGGNFNITWTTVLASLGASPGEVVLEFSCPTAATSTLKCYGKPGDSQLLCDPVANAVVAGLENALGANVENSPLYKGLSIATIAEGIVETLKLVSRLNPTTDYASQLAAANSPAAIRAILAGSPIGSLFQSLQTLAAQAVAQNQTAAAGAAAQQTALQSVWTVGKVVELLAGLGITIQVGFDDNSNGVSIYGALVPTIDNGTNSTFMEDTQKYVSALYDSLYSTTPTTAATVTLLCQGTNYNVNNGQPVSWPPDIAGLLSDGVTKQFTCFGATAEKLGVASGGQTIGNWNVGAVIQSTSLEADRNDPDGTHMNQYSINFDMSIVNVFSEIDNAIDPNGVCAGFVTSGNNGPGAGTDFAGLGTCIYQHGLSGYFGDVLGVYRFLTNSSVQGAQVSLDDIFQALVDTMGLRLTGSSLYSQLNSVNVLFSDGPYVGDNFYIPIFLFDAQQVAGSDQVFYSSCPDLLCTDGVPNNTSTVSTAEFSDLYIQARPAFSLLFGEYLTLPDLQTVKSWIFTASHHVDYNTVGVRFYSVMGKDDTGNFNTDRPILCKITDPTGAITQQFLTGDAVECELGQGEWTAQGNQIMDANYKDYTGYFALQNGPSTGSQVYYALMNQYTGQQSTTNGQMFLVRDVSADPGALDPNGNPVIADGKTLYLDNSQFCNTYVNASNNYQTSCYQDVFLYVALSFPNYNVNPNSVTIAQSFYPVEVYQPYSWQVPISRVDPVSGQVTQETVPIGITTGSADPNITSLQNAWPVCINGTGVSVDPNNQSAVTGYSLPGNVLSCNSGSLQTTFYYLGLNYNYSTPPNNPSEYDYVLIRNDGLWMQNDTFSGNANVALTAVQAANGGLLMGPQETQVYIPTWDIANPKWNAKFDPFCNDLDGDGYCDCYRDVNGDGTFSLHLTGTSIPTDANCNLSDNVGDEPTISQSPIYSGDPNAAKEWYAINTCGGLSATALQTCLLQLGSVYDLNNWGINWNLVFTCANGNQLTWVDTSSVTTNPNGAGGNCGPAGQSGPVTFTKVVSRNNAYNISQPQTALKLFATATQSTGNDVTIGRDDSVFSYNQAVAMAFFRLAVPVDNVTVQGVDYTQPVPSNDPATFIPYTGFVPQLVQLNLGNQQDVASAVLRSFLNKTNQVTQ